MPQSTEYYLHPPIHTTAALAVFFFRFVGVPTRPCLDLLYALDIDPQLFSVNARLAKRSLLLMRRWRTDVEGMVMGDV